MEQYLQQTPVASVIFIFTIVTTLYAFYNEAALNKLMLHPYSIHRGEKLYTIFTSALIHKDWMHLFFNMFTFYAFAFRLEETMGHWQFAVLYLASMPLSDVTTIAKQKNNMWYHSLGASGAISAVLFSAILFFPKMTLMIFPLPIPIPAIIFGPLYLIYSAYASKQSSHINHDAHFFGAISGLIITIVLFPPIIKHFLAELLG